MCSGKNAIYNMSVVLLYGYIVHHSRVDQICFYIKSSVTYTPCICICI